MKPKQPTAIWMRVLMFAAVLTAVSANLLWASSEGGTAPSQPSMAAVQSVYGKLPLSFEANHGQWGTPVQFVTRGHGHTLFMTPNQAVLDLQTGTVKEQRQATDAAQHKPLSSPAPISHSIVRMTFDGADPQATVVGLDQLPGIVNYFIGDDPSKWHTNIPTYQKVAYHNLYPGIDLVYYGNQGHLEYDLIVAPRADPTQITLAFDGAEQIAVDAQGDLVLTLASTEVGEGMAPTLRLHKPVVYQRDERGAKHLLAGAYVLRASTTAALDPRETPQIVFQVASYDVNKPLIIDPVLSWATYLGGSDSDGGHNIAVDTAGDVYVTGVTSSSDFPGTSGSPIQNMYGGFHFDAFVTKLNASGTTILYSTYLGGSGNDEGFGIAVDAAGNAYVTGLTESLAFPGTAGSRIQSTIGGGHDGFVTKLNTTGTALLYSTYLGGSGADEGNGIAVDVAGNAYVTGLTESLDFSGTAGSRIQSMIGGSFDAFVTKLNASGTTILYSTYLGGSNSDRGFGIAVDPKGQAYVTGETGSPAFPGTVGSPVQSTYGGGDRDAFVTKLNASGTAILYATYLGGSGDDQGFGIAVDAAGNAYVTGETGSPAFPGTVGSPVQSTYGGGDRDAFVTKINATGRAILYATYLGGNGGDRGFGIAVDAAGNAYVTGETESPSFPGTAGSPLQNTIGGGHDGFVTKLNTTGTALLYSTYLGGNSADGGVGIAVDAAGNAYVTGFTGSSNFPGTEGNPIQHALGGIGDAFVAKITTSIPFAAFGARAEIELHHRQHHEDAESRHHRHQDDAELRDHRGHGDEFDMKATFTLGSGSNGIAPLTEAVTIQVGPFTTTIPAGSFKQHKGRFVFEGVIHGVHLEAVLRSLILGNDYEFRVEGKGANLTGTRNPVTVSLTIGDDSGSKAITAKIK